MGSSSGFQSLLAMLAEHSLWGRLRSLKWGIFVSLWKPIAEKTWSAVLASLMNHFDHRIDILDWSASTCLCPHDFMMYPSDCLIFPSLRVSRLSHVYPHDWCLSLIQCLVNMLSATLTFAQTHDSDTTEQYVDWGNNINFIFMRDQNSPPPLNNTRSGIL